MFTLIAFVILFILSFVVAYIGWKSYGDSQQQAAERYITKLGEAKVWPGRIVTEVSPLQGFHPAEEYHQNYLVRHPTQPYIVVNDLPKLEELRKRYPELVRRTS